MMNRINVVLEDATSLKSSIELDFREVISEFKRIMQSKVVSNPIIVDEASNTILMGHRVFFALGLLSAKKVPVVKVDVSKISKHRNLTSYLEEVSKRLPKVEFTLNELDVWPKEDPRVLKVYESTLDLLVRGWPTPLVKFNSLSSDSRSVWAKLEGFNPFSNSVKDRIGWSMIMDALKKSELKEILYEATSTNTGIALTSIANILGKKTKLFIPKSIQRVSDTFLRILGAEVVRMPVSLTVEAIDEVDVEAKMVGASHLNQFENDANFKVHLKYTAKELDLQLMSLDLKPTHIIGGLGTSGHMSAISLYFKSKYGDDVKVIGVQPAPDEVIPGIRRIETGMKWIHWVKFDEIVDVKLDEAIEGVIRVARSEGLLIGLSAGAVVNAFTKVAEEEGVYVLVLPDTGYKYAEQFESYLSKRGTLT